MVLKTLFFDLDNTLIPSNQADELVLTRVTKFLVTQHPTIDAQLFKSCLKKQADRIFEKYLFYDFAVQIGISPMEGLWGEFQDSGVRFSELYGQIKAYRQEVWLMALHDVGIADYRLAKLLSLMFMTMRTDICLIYEDTYQLLDSLYEQYQLILLSNGAPSLQHHKLNKLPKLKKYFKKVIISGDFGQAKPALDFFEFAISRAQADYASTLMIGDELYTDILGANLADISTVWLNRNHQENEGMITPDFTVTKLPEVLQIIEKVDRR